MKRKSKISGTSGAQKAEPDGFCPHKFKSIFPYPYRKGKFMVECRICGKTGEWKGDANYAL